MDSGFDFASSSAAWKVQSALFDLRGFVLGPNDRMQSLELLEEIARTAVSGGRPESENLLDRLN